MLSEGETHVAAMRLVCQSLEDHERQGIEIQWDVLYQQLDHMDTILQGITDQRNDDAEQIQILKQARHAARAISADLQQQLDVSRKETAEVRRRNFELVKERDAAHEQISTVRDQVAAEVANEIASLRQQLSADAIRQELEELKAKNFELLEKLATVENAAANENESLRGAMRADDKRLRDAEERVWPGETRGCDAPDAMADEILHLRQLLENANRELSEQAMVSNVEAQQDAAAWQQQLDGAQAEVKYLRDRLDEARSVNVDLQGQLDAARSDNVEIRKRLNEEIDRHRATHAEKIDLFQKLEWANQHAAELVKERDAAHTTILAQKRGNQYLRRLIEKVRGIVNRDDAMSERLYEIELAIDQFDQGTPEPTPATEPARCPECETTIQQLAEANKQWQLVAQQREQDRTRLREYEQIVAQNNSAMDAARKKIAEQEAQVADLNDKLAAKTLGEGTEPAPATEQRWFRSQVQIDGCVGRTTDGEDHWESVTVWVSGQPAEWRQTISRASGQIPEWLWKSLPLHTLYHAETTFNRHTNMMEFRNWELCPQPAQATEPESNSSATLTGSPEPEGGQ